MALCVGCAFVGCSLLRVCLVLMDWCLLFGACCLWVVGVVVCWLLFAVRCWMIDARSLLLVVRWSPDVDYCLLCVRCYCLSLDDVSYVLFAAVGFLFIVVCCSLCVIVRCFLLVVRHLPFDVVCH